MTRDRRSQPAAKTVASPLAQAARPDEAPPRRRTRAPHIRRAALMDAAEQLFLSKGVAATSVDDIVAAAQVAKGTFYLYFASRDAMLGALQQRFMQGFCERLDKALARPAADDWDGRLRAWFEAALDGLLGQVMLHDMLFHDVRPDEREFMMGNPVLDQLAQLVQAGARAGAWQVADARAMAVMMFYAMHGLADDAVACGTARRRKPMVQLLTRTFSRALRMNESEP
ncbi:MULTISPECIES: TetR/AcrR family transcriptional regulator [Comamonadaceae]|uniref:TetR/AcrR family transcriptional regulator n=1 Tax=Acidovorax sacchari TaxID=3230736 RepID=UPI0034A53863